MVLGSKGGAYTMAMVNKHTGWQFQIPPHDASRDLGIGRVLPSPLPNSHISASIFLDSMVIKNLSCAKKPNKNCHEIHFNKKSGQTTEKTSPKVDPF